MTTRIYSNLDHQLDHEVVKKALKTPGEKFQHSAWDFCGYIHWDEDSEEWVEEVWVYHSVIGTFRNKNLIDLIDEVNSKYEYK
jgi:hypothetical protein